MSAEGMKAGLRHRTPPLGRFGPVTTNPGWRMFLFESGDLWRRPPADLSALERQKRFGSEWRQQVVGKTSPADIYSDI